MPMNALIVQTMRDQAERMEVGALMLRKAAETIEFLSAELVRARLGAVTERQEPISQPLSQSYPAQETPALRASTPAENNTQPNQRVALAQTTAARVPAPSSRVDAIPTVESADKSNSVRLSANLIAKVMLRRQGLSSGAGKLSDVISDHAHWKKEAEGYWPRLTGLDQRRVKQRQAELESLIREHEDVLARAGDARRPAASAIDPDTSEILEAAE